jgi:putative membrane protein
MNFIDYVTLMLINMTAALVVLAVFLWKGLDEEDPKHWAPAFAVPGLVAAVCGFAMTFTWPLPGPYNIAFGEMSVLLGVLLLGASWSLARSWNLRPLGIYAFFAGAAAVLVGIRFIDLSLTKSPLLSGVGFILTGLGGIFAGFILIQAKNKGPRLIGALVMLAAAAIWAWTAALAYWTHLLPQK